MPVAQGDDVTLSHTAPGITTSSAAALAANTARVYALFVNDSDTVIYLGIGVTAVLNAGIRLAANGGSFEMGVRFGNVDLRAVNAIHGGSGAKVLLVSEGT